MRSVLIPVDPSQGAAEAKVEFESDICESVGVRMIGVVAVEVLSESVSGSNNSDEAIWIDCSVVVEVVISPVFRVDTGTESRPWVFEVVGSISSYREVRAGSEDVSVCVAVVESYWKVL